MLRAADWEHGDVKLFHGDCHDIIPEIGIDDIGGIITDPPYGMRWTGKELNRNPKTTQGSNTSRFKGIKIIGDDKDFDPRHLLKFNKVLLWGMHHFPQHLSRGSLLIWIKKNPNAFGSFLSDGDAAWFNSGHGVWCSPVINPASFQKHRFHPTQKPVELMQWSIQKAGIKPGEVVCDPYMGSGSTGVGAVREGCGFIGVEIDRGYYEHAVRRIGAELGQGKLKI